MTVVELCNDCGACCSPVSLPHGQTEVAAMTTAEAATLGIDDRTRRWILHDLTPMRPRDAYLLAPWKRTSMAMPRTGGSVRPFFYSCRHYDADNRRCTDYDNRPDLCRGYPRYGAARVPVNAELPPMCGFRSDQGRPVEPWQPVHLRTKP